MYANKSPVSVPFMCDLVRSLVVHGICSVCVQAVWVAGGAASWATPASPGLRRARIMLTASWVNYQVKFTTYIRGPTVSPITLILLCTGIKDALYQEGGEYRCVGARAPDLMRLKELKRVTLKVTGEHECMVWAS